MFIDAARSLGIFRSDHTPSGLYNQDCENKRKMLLSHKNKYRQLKNNNNLQQLRQTGEDCKNKINKAVRNINSKLYNKYEILNPKICATTGILLIVKIYPKRLVNFRLRYSKNTLKT